jgi:hypothetical protein
LVYAIQLLFSLLGSAEMLDLELIHFLDLHFELWLTMAEKVAAIGLVVSIVQIVSGV